MNDAQITEVIENYFGIKTRIREEMRKVDELERKREIYPWDAADRWQALDAELTSSPERIAYIELYQNIQTDDELEKRFRNIYSNYI